MTYLPKFVAPASPNIDINAYESVAVQYRNSTGGNLGSSAWSTSNQAVYIPVVLRQSVTITSFYSCNGATASNNFDIGIFSVDGSKIISTGSTAQSGTSTIQTVSVTNTDVGPGVFYIGMTMNGTTGTVYQLSAAVYLGPFLGIYQQTSAFPLPASATFATLGSTTKIPQFGFQWI